MVCVCACVCVCEYTANICNQIKALKLVNWRGFDAETNSWELSKLGLQLAANIE